MNRAIKKTLNVEDMRNVNHMPQNAFKVKKMVNTATFKIGDYMSKTKLQRFCDMTDWTVNVVEFKR